MGTAGWGPPDGDLWCGYATDWAEIKERWGLTMTQIESEIVMDMLGTCENPPEVEVEKQDFLGSVTGERISQLWRLREQCTSPARTPQRPVNSGCGGAAGAGRDSQRQWCHLHGMGTGTAWSAKIRSSVPEE